MIKTLEEKLNVKFPNSEHLASPEANKFLNDLCLKHQVRTNNIFLNSFTDVLFFHRLNVHLLGLVRDY